MTQVTLTMTFANAAEAAAFLAGKPASAPAPTTKAAAPTPTPAATSPTAAAASAAAPETKVLDFDKDVVNGALLPYSKKASRDEFAKLMSAAGVQKVPGLKDKPATWEAIINYVANPSEANLAAVKAAA